MPVEPLSQKEIEDQLAELPGWSLDGDHLARSYHLPLRRDRDGRHRQVDEELDHHSDLTLGYNTISLTVNTHSVGGAVLTELDLKLARRVEALAPGHGAH